MLNLDFTRSCVLWGSGIYIAVGVREGLGLHMAAIMVYAFDACCELQVRVCVPFPPRELETGA